MATDSILSSKPMRPARRRRRKSIARLFGALNVPMNEAQRANRLRDGCIVPLDLDHVRPDCLLPADVASLYTEIDNLQMSPSQLTSVSIISKSTIYARLNSVRIAAYENQSIEIEIGIFDLNAERFLTENVILSSETDSLSDWVGFLDVDITPTCMIVVRIYIIGALVKDCSSIRDCRRQIGLACLPALRVNSEAPLIQHDLPVIRPKSDRLFAKSLTSPATNRCQRSMAFKLRLQTANMVPLGTRYRPASIQSTNGDQESGSLIRFDIISGEFRNVFKTSQMNICIEAFVIVRGTTKELACLKRGPGKLFSSYSSGIVYHCNNPEFHETFTISIDAIRGEIQDERASVLLRAVHVARCGTVTTLGYVILTIFDRESGKISTTNDQIVGVQLRDIDDHKNTKHRVFFRSTIVSKHDTDNDVLALILTGKAMETDLKLAHVHIQNCTDLDMLLQTKLMEHYLAKGSYRKDATLNAAWSLYCLLRRRTLIRGVALDPIPADILIANIVLCFHFNMVDLLDLSLEIFNDRSSIVITDLSTSLADCLIASADSGSGILTGRSLMLLFKLMTNVVSPDQLRSAFDRLILRIDRCHVMKSAMANLSELSGLSQLNCQLDDKGLLSSAIRQASASDDACYLLARPLPLLLNAKPSEEDVQSLLLLLPRLYRILNKPGLDPRLSDIQILVIEIARLLHSRCISIPSDEVALHLDYISRIANNSAFDPAAIILRVMELHCATLILDLIPVSESTDLLVSKTLLNLLNGKDIESYRIRQRRSAYINRHVTMWLRPWLLRILLRHSSISPDQIALQLLLRLMIRERRHSVDLQVLLRTWESMGNIDVYKLAVCSEIFLLIRDQCLYPNAIRFLRQAEGLWESQSFASCLICLAEANLISSEGNIDQKADALISALNSVQHITKALHIRLYIIDQLICLYESIQLISPALAQCYLERGETRHSTDPSRFSDFRKSLEIFTGCFEWEKAAMICERIISGYSVPDKDSNFVPCFRRIRAGLLRRIQTEDRVMPQYARVAFSASTSHNASERGREYIYRLKPGETVLEFSDWFRKQYPYAEIKNSYLDLSSLKNDPVIAIQRIEVSSQQQHGDISVDPSIDSLSLPIRFRHFSSHSDASSFSFFKLEVIPSKVPGSSARQDADVSCQWYEVHHLTVANKFPFLSRRQLITNHTKYWQSPIQTAVITVRQVTQKLQREMEKIVFAAKQKDGSIDVSQLSLVLSGIIDAPVNGGIAVYRSCFLGDSENYSQEQEDLLTAIKNQACVLRKGLSLFKDSVSSALLPLYAHLESRMQNTFPNS